MFEATALNRRNERVEWLWKMLFLLMTVLLVVPVLIILGMLALLLVLAYAGLRNTYAGVSRGVFAVERESLLSRSDLLHVSPAQQQGSVKDRIAVEALSRPGPALARTPRTPDESA